MFSKKFKIDNLEYLVEVSDSNSISFRVVSGLSKSHKSTDRNNLFSEFDSESDSYLDLNITNNPFLVFSKVKEIAIGWIKSSSPDHFSFSSSTERKNKIYDKLVNRVVSNDTYFTDNYYGYTHEEGSYVFYKKL